MQEPSRGRPRKRAASNGPHLDIKRELGYDIVAIVASGRFLEDDSTSSSAAESLMSMSGIFSNT